MNWRGTTVRDWLLLAISVGFVVIGLVLLVSGRAGTGPLAVFAFFGMCAVVAVQSISAKLRAHQVSLDPSLVMPVTGGVPIVANRRRPIVASVGLLALGVFLAVTGGPLGRGFVVLCVLMAGLGAGLLVALAVGWGKRPTLTFTPEGLRFSSAAISYLAPWEVMSVRLLTLQEQPFVGLWLQHAARVVADAQVASGEPTLERAKLARRLEKNLSWCGVHLTLSGPAYDTETLLLLHTLQRYVSDPVAREELL